MKARSLFVMIVGICGCSSLAVADDWPQWRGPRRDGISKESGLLAQWPAEGPKLVWQAHEIGEGYSTPAVVAIGCI